MKKGVLFLYLFSILSLSSMAQENVFLQGDFWSKNPTIEQVKKEIVAGNDPTASNDRAFDAVTLAINGNASLDVIQYLLTFPENSVDKKTHHSRSYLHWAAAKGNADVVKHLISIGADVNFKDSYGTPVVAYAASGGNKNLDVYEILFQNGVNPLATFENGSNLILLAAPTDTDFFLINYFVSKGLDLKSVDDAGANAFDYAARSGNKQLLNQYHEKGINPTGNAQFFAAQGSRNRQNGLEVFKYLVEELGVDPLYIHKKEGTQMLHQLARNGAPDIFNYYLSKKLDVNKTDAEGNTVFILAAQNANLEILQAVAAQTKDVNHANAKGQTALMKAAEAYNPQTFQFILQAGADLNQMDVEGKNVLFYVFDGFNDGRKKDFNTFLNALNAYSYDFKEPLKDGTQAFHWAVSKENFYLIEKANELGADVNKQDAEGMTSLHKAALIAKNQDILKLLITLGADTQIVNEWEETPYALAMENEMLKNNGINIDFLK